MMCAEANRMRCKAPGEWFDVRFDNGDSDTYGLTPEGVVTDYAGRPLDLSIEKNAAAREAIVGF